MLTPLFCREIALCSQLEKLNLSLEGQMKKDKFGFVLAQELVLSDVRNLSFINARCWPNLFALGLLKRRNPKITVVLNFRLKKLTPNAGLRYFLAYSLYTKEPPIVSGLLNNQLFGMYQYISTL